MYLPHAKSLLFRFSHGARFTATAKLINAQPDETILDYGCADGRLLQLLIPSGAKLLGYDIAPEVQDELRAIRGIEVVTDTSHLERCSCDTIALCEVLEHVLTGDAAKILSECKRLLKPAGKLIVSVPIEVGLSALIKSLARLVAVRPLEFDMTAKNVLRSVFYLPVKRHDYGGYHFHTGFDYRTISRQLNAAGLSVESKHFSPVHAFGPLLNSQVIYQATAHR